jgi:Delta7-sterol 5-desaturase
MNYLFNQPGSTVSDFVSYVLGSTRELSVRYALLAGIVWLLCYVIFKRRWFHRKIIARFPQSSDVWREIGYSASSVVIFSIVGAATMLLIKGGWTQMYFKLGDRSGLWFVSSIALAAMLHDTWFYWTHRLMHHPRLFRWFHRTHHRSHNPTPWAAYAFDPLEAVVQALIFPLAVILIPMHGYAFALFMLWQISFNILGHTGYEIMPRWFMKTPLRYILNTPTNHIMHHETLKGNYGLYFNIWDRLMGTNHKNYEGRFHDVTMRRAAHGSIARTDPLTSE